MSDKANEQEDWQARAKAAEVALDRMKSETKTRIIQAELKLEALRAGMIDLDGIKLLDTEKLALSEAGSVADAAQQIDRLKSEKPWLFSKPASSTGTFWEPRPEPPRQRHANELSREEWLKARAALVRGR